jgi:hypothetical protein
MKTDGRTYTLYPVDTRDWIIGKFTELGNATAAGVPHVDTWSESYSEGILAAPVNEVEIEVICKIRCIQNLVWHLGDGAGLALRAKKHALTAVLDGWQAVEIWTGVEVEDTMTAWGRPWWSRLTGVGEQVLVRGWRGPWGWR